MEKQKYPPKVQYERTEADAIAEDASEAADWEAGSMDMAMNKTNPVDRARLAELAKANPDTLRKLGKGVMTGSVEFTAKEAGRHDLGTTITEGNSARDSGNIITMPETPNTDMGKMAGRAELAGLQQNQQAQEMTTITQAQTQERQL